MNLLARLRKVKACLNLFTTLIRCVPTYVTNQTVVSTVHSEPYISLLDTKHFENRFIPHNLKALHYQPQIATPTLL